MFAEVGPVVNSTELLVVRDALLHIHKAFYEKMKSETPSVASVSTADVIREIRSRVLSARVVYFDGLLQNEVTLLLWGES